jgi:chromosome segregation ATPase
VKTPIRYIAFLLLITTPLAFGQRGGTAVRTSRNRQVNDSAKLLMKATDDQGMTFARCMEATARVRTVIGQMGRAGTPWNRSRLSYSRGDLQSLSSHKEQLEAALADLEAVHQAFLKELTDDQKSGLERHLVKLDHLQAKLNSEIPQIDHDLKAAKPGPGSPNISWDVNAMKTAAGKWHAEHKRIGKEMGIPQ